MRECVNVCACMHVGGQWLPEKSVCVCAGGGVGGQLPAFRLTQSSSYLKKHISDVGG